MALPSGGMDPEIGFMSHCPILRPVYYLPPFPPFLAYFLTYLASFLAPPFLGSVFRAAEIFLAAYNLDYLYFLMF